MGDVINLRGARTPARSETIGDLAARVNRQAISILGRDTLDPELREHADATDELLRALAEANGGGAA